MDSDLKHLRWKCRRGMKELDTLLLEYLDIAYSSASEAHKAAFALVLDMPDPELWALLTGKSVSEIRAVNDIISSFRQSNQS